MYKEQGSLWGMSPLLLVSLLCLLRVVTGSLPGLQGQADQLGAADTCRGSVNTVGMACGICRHKYMSGFWLSADCAVRLDFWCRPALNQAEKTKH